MRLVMGVGHWRLIGGSERYAQETARHLVARGHQVTVLHGTGDGQPSPGLDFERCESLGDLSAPHKGRRHLRRRLKALAPDLIFQLTPCSSWVLEEYLRAAPLARFVQDHTLFCPGLNKMLADGRPCGDPLGKGCLTRHWFGDSCHGLGGAHRRTDILGPAARLRSKQRELTLSAQARLLLVGSGYMHEQLLAAGLPAERVQVLPYCTHAGTNTAPTQQAELPEATRAFLSKRDSPLLLTPARLTLPDKGVDFLLTALTKVTEPLCAVIAGDGPAAEWLQRKAMDEGLGDRVHFSGWLGAGPLETLYAMADLVVFPSVWDEPFGLVGIEAMAHGVPVVAFDVGGVAEWLQDGVGGWRVPRRDVDAMARAIRRALCEPETRRTAGNSGRGRVERDFRPEAYYDRLETLLENCLDREPQGAPPPPPALPEPKPLMSDPAPGPRP